MMMEKERIMPELERSRAFSGSGVSAGDFAEHFCESLNTISYTHLPAKEKITEETQVYKDNESFWSNISDHLEGEPVYLKEFHLTQWIPRSPGTYFLPKSKEKREQGSMYLSDGVYLPAGKEAMALSGLGSIRLMSKVIDSLVADLSPFPFNSFRTS